MALTNLNELGATIRGKVGEEEKQTLPQLKSIVGNQLVYPQGEYTATTNGIYDIRNYNTVEVETDERTPIDYRNSAFASSVRTWIESLVNININYVPWQMGDSTHLIDLPYFKTENATSAFNVTQGFKQANYVRSIGFDLSSASDYNMNILSSNVKVAYLTGMTHLDWASAFYNKYYIEELYFDEVRTLGGNKSFNGAFNHCRALKRIGGFNKSTELIDDAYGKVNFSGCTDTTYMFYDCGSLEEVRFVPNTLNLTLSMSNSPSLTRATVLSLINCLGSNRYTISLHADVKGKMASEWKCKLNTDTGLFEDSTDADAISYTEAVTNSTSGKGWILG